MSQGLKFTPDEQREFEDMTKLHPKGIGQKLSVRFDAVANTIGMFFGLLMYSIVGPSLFPQYLNQELYISNVYQLVALPLLGVSTALSTAIILRFLFRILLEVRTEFAEVKLLHRENREMHKEIHAVALNIQNGQDAQCRKIAEYLAEALKTNGVMPNENRR